MTSIKGRVGPMKSGKTMWLLNKMTRYADNGKKVIYVHHKSNILTKTGNVENYISSHSSTTFVLSKNITKVTSETLHEALYNKLDEFDVIAIDECHFFKDLTSFIFNNILSKDLKKTIIFSGLDYDSDANLFGNMKSFLCVAEYKRILGICELCKDEGKINKSTYSMWVSNRLKDTQIKVGGSDLYKPVCYKHFIKHNFKPSFSN